MREIGSNDVEDLLIKWNEPELWSAFRAIVVCHDGILNTSTEPKVHGKDRFEEKRRIIELKKDIVIKLAKEFDLDVSPLFEALNIPIENIIKKTCKELGLTYAQLAEQIGYKPDTINKSASTGNVSEQLKKAVEMYLENLELKNQLNEYDELKKLLKKAIN